MPIAPIKRETAGATRSFNRARDASDFLPMTFSTSRRATFVYSFIVHSVHSAEFAFDAK